MEDANEWIFAMLWLIPIGYALGWLFSWRCLIRWGIEDYKVSGLYPKYWDMGNVALLTFLSFLWPLGVLMGYALIKPHPQKTHPPSKLEKFVGVKSK